MSLADAIIEEDIVAVDQYLQTNVDLNAIDEYGFSPLIQAAIMNNSAIGEKLLKAGANPNQTDLSGRTALHWAADNSNQTFCELLLKNKADANAYTLQGQPVLVMPVLRNAEKLKKLLYDYGASLNFAQDFIQAKLIGHRYELKGVTHIANHKNKFVLVDFEGFFLEFSLGLIRESLTKYKHNFIGKNMRPYFGLIEYVLAALSIASELIKFQQYTVNLDQYENRINKLCQYEPFILPAVYQGHAISFVKLGPWLAKCDRGQNSQFESSITIYKITHTEKFNVDLIKRLMYTKSTDEFMHGGINELLGLVTTYTIPLRSQISGNCSWANVEASIPSLLFLLLLHHQPKEDIDDLTRQALYVYHQWREFDKDRALNECVQAISYNEPERSISKVAVLAHILQHLLSQTRPRAADAARIETIREVLLKGKNRFVINSFIDVYHKKYQTPAGQLLSEMFPDKSF